MHEIKRLLFEMSQLPITIQPHIKRVINVLRIKQLPLCDRVVWMCFMYLILIVSMKCVKDVFFKYNLFLIVISSVFRVYLFIHHCLSNVEFINCFVFFRLVSHSSFLQNKACRFVGN